MGEFGGQGDAAIGVFGGVGFEHIGFGGDGHVRCAVEAEAVENCRAGFVEVETDLLAALGLFGQEFALAGGDDAGVGLRAVVGEGDFAEVGQHAGEVGILRGAATGGGGQTPGDIGGE